MAKGCRKCPEVECEECPEWIFTLADLIMCMMGLFVILWVLKPSGAPAAGAAGDAGQQEQYIRIAAGIREGFGYVPDPASLDPVDMMMIRMRMEGDRMPRGPGEGGRTQADHGGAEGPDPEVTTIRPGNYSLVGTALMFEAGSTTADETVRRQVRQIAEIIRGHRQIVFVRGHASLDDLPAEATEADRLNLSLDRARAVAQLLMAEGISPQVIRVQGSSTWEPARRGRFGPDAQAANRRVEVEVSDQLVEERQGRRGQ